MTRPPASRALPAFLCLLAALSAGCDRPGNRTDTARESGAGKTLIRTACSDEAYAPFLKIVEDYSSRRD
ncbi:MAG: hypothetical protein ACM31I_10160, partial [Deltaproteobacteria bacterium]